MSKGKHKMGLLKIINSFKDMGFFAKEVNGERELRCRADKLYFTASCFKVITAISLYHKLEKEGMDDSLELSYNEDDKIGGSGILKDLKPHTNSIYNYACLMLKKSDNTATDLLLKYVTKNYQNRIILKLGLKKTKVRLNCRRMLNDAVGLPFGSTHEECDMAFPALNNKPLKGAISNDLNLSNVSTPYELCKTLEELVNPRLITKENANKILRMMKKDNDFEKGVEIREKDGYMPGVRAYVGIAYTDNPFYFAILAKHLIGEEDDRYFDKYYALLRKTASYFM